MSIETAELNGARTRAARIHKLVVRDVVEETADAVSIVFESNQDVDYRPGQFLTLEIPSTQTGSVSRCYSLSSAPKVDRHLAVTVKRTVDGYASNWLCDNATPGMVLNVLAPTGTFVPRSWDTDLLLVAAGSGITPMLSIIKTAVAAHSNAITLIYANRSRESTIFDAELADIQARHPQRLTVVHWLESESGLPTVSGLSDSIGNASDCDAFLCGPAPFMDIAEQGVRSAGVSRERIHREVFRSLTANPFDETPAVSAAVTTGGSTGFASASVEIDGDLHAFEWKTDEVLLDVLLDRGVDAPYVCREGSCGGCAFRLTGGEVKMLVNDTLDSYELDRGVRLACQSLPVSEHVDAVFE